MGAAAANRWRVGARTVDLVRTPPAPRPAPLAADPQDLVIDLARAAFLIVDMQNDFCTKGGWLDYRGIDYHAGPQADRAARARWSTRSARPDIPVVWLNWGVRKDLLNISPSLRARPRSAGAGPACADRAGHPRRGDRSREAGAPRWSTR